MQNVLRWKEVHSHRAVVSSLAWSPSGEHLCVASFDGQVSLLESQSWACTKLVDPPRGDKLAWGAHAAWDVAGEAVAVASVSGFRLLDVTGQQIASFDGLCVRMLRARPSIGGYAWAESEGGPDFAGISDAQGASVRRIAYPGTQVRDLAWSPDGRNLAIACERGVAVTHPGMDNTADVPIIGGAHTLIWLDNSCLAVGCSDSNIRVYSWPSGVERSIPSTGNYEQFFRRPSAELLDVLEAHDDWVAQLSGPNSQGQFVSRDGHGTLCIWMPANGRHALMLSQQLSSKGQSVAVALHPNRNVIALDLEEIVSVAEYQSSVAPAIASSAATSGSPILIGKALQRAGMTGTVVHSDAISHAWDLGAERRDGDSAQLLAVTRACKEIARATKQLIELVDRCLRALWSRPEVSTAVELELLEFTAPSTSDAVGEVRRRLLALLATEIESDRPHMRAWAIAAYVGVGYLGSKEAEAAFGPDSSAHRLLIKMDEGMRRAVHVGAGLWSERRAASVAEAVKVAAQSIDRILNAHNATGGTFLRTDVPHTLILKGGGAKGLAHVGALLEVSRYYPFDRFAGTSAGAIVAVLLGAGFTPSELLAELRSINFHDKISESWLRRAWNLMTKFGLYSGDDLQNWLGDLLRQKDRRAMGPVMMTRLPVHTTVYACQPHKAVLTLDSKHASADNEPASHAARCSMSIPFYFTPTKVGGIYVFDGGLRINYPVDQVLADDPDKPFIGLYLGAPSTGLDAGRTVIQAFLQAMFEAKDTELAELHRPSTVVIDTHPIGTLDFRLSDEEKDFLVMSGRVAALRFLEDEKEIELSDRHVVEKMFADREHLQQRLVRARLRRAKGRRHIGWAVLLLTAGAVATQWVPLL